MKTDYDVKVQRLMLEIMMGAPSIFARVQNIYDPGLFDRSIKPAAQFLADYADEYHAIPTPAQIFAKTNIQLNPAETVTSDIEEWCLTEFEGFIKHESLKRAILESADMIERGEYEPIERLIKDAVQIGLTRDLGINYYDNPRERLLALKSENGQMSTGWKTLDNAIFGGFNRGELEIFAGPSGAGKSLFLQNLSMNWSELGLPGVYITLELSQGLSAMRMDSMTVGISSKEIFKSLDDVDLKVRMKAKKSAPIQIKKLPAQSTVNDIRAYIKELQIQSGMKIEYICVDYLDLLMPVSVKVSPSDLFVKDKYVSEELRNLAEELDVVMVSASQLNRGAVEEIEFNHSHISGGISKINTADNVFGIFTSRSMRENGQYQLQMMKTRNSSGFGQKIDLQFDVASLRITDYPDDAGIPQSSSVSSGILDRIKRKSTESPDTGQPNSDKLKSMLADLKR